jgi:putative addiction module component (TIGR02574 family)
MILERIPDVQKLTAPEKLLLVGEIWDDLAAHPSEVPVTPEQIAEIDRRMEAYRNDPSRVTTWEEVRKRILGEAP